MILVLPFGLQLRLLSLEQLGDERQAKLNENRPERG